MKHLLILLLLLCACTCQDLDPEWAPLERVCERPGFLGTADATTVGDAIYVKDIEAFYEEYPLGSIPHKAIMTHEQAHAVRQLGYNGLSGRFAVMAWVSRYMTDRSFKLLEEQVGFYHSITIRRDGGIWSEAETIGLAYMLTDNYRMPDGSRIIDFDSAVAWVRDVLRGAWLPPEE